MKRSLAACLRVSSFVLLMAFGLTACQDNSPNKEWNAGAPLTWGDFQGERPEDARHDAETAVGITASSWKCEQGTFGFVGARAYFNRTKSFSTPSKADAELLKHEQGHFDLIELYARYLRERIRTNRCDREPEAIQADINSALRDVGKGFTDESARYDEETSHGRDQDGQRVWDRKLRDRLEQTKGQ